MKKTKLLGLITLPLVVGGAGVLFASNMTNNNEEVIFQKELKEIKSVANDGFVKDLSLGENFTEVVITDAAGNDHLYAWGANNFGQLGLGYKNSYEWLPQEVTKFEDNQIKNVEANGYNSAVVVTDSLGYDHLYMVGRNDKGQLGVGNKDDSYNFMEVSLPQNIVVKDLSVGRFNSMAIVTDTVGIDHVYSWGYNLHGQLGTGSSYGATTSFVTSPKEISSKFGSYSSIKEIETEESTSGAIVTNAQGKDQLYMWGYNYYGQLGDNSATQRITPKLVTTNLSNYNNLSNLSLGWYHSGVVATDSNGNDHLFTWGLNDDGQLGISKNGGRMYVPTEITSISQNQFVDFSLGSSHSAVVSVDSTGEEHVYTWGCNGNGELGDGTSGGSRNAPIEISMPEGEEYDIELGYHTSSVIVTDSYGQNDFYLWGNNQSGQMGNGTTDSVITPTPGGDNIDRVSLSTTFIEQVSSEEFIFEISSSVASDLSENVAVYNSNGVKVGDTTLTVKEETSKESSIVYSYDAIITDFDNASSSELYWSIDGGQTLNLISENRFEFSEQNNTNVVIYSSIGIGLVILIVLIIVFVVLFLTKDNDKEESQEDNWDQQKSKKEKKSKKNKDEENRKKQNDVLDAF